MCKVLSYFLSRLSMQLEISSVFATPPHSAQSITDKKLASLSNHTFVIGALELHRETFIGKCSCKSTLKFLCL